MYFRMLVTVVHVLPSQGVWGLALCYGTALLAICTAGFLGPETMTRKVYRDVDYGQLEVVFKTTRSPLNGPATVAFTSFSFFLGLGSAGAHGWRVGVNMCTGMCAVRVVAPPPLRLREPRSSTAT